MTINKSNYEAFALDYLENNLPDNQTKAMRAFLTANPLIASEIEALRDAPTFVPDESIVFDHKELLLQEEGKVKLIGMNSKLWYRVGSIAAALAILLIGYLAGYFSANQRLFNSFAENKTVEEASSSSFYEPLETLEDQKDSMTNLESEASTQHQPTEQPVKRQIASTKPSSVTKFPEGSQNFVAVEPIITLSKKETLLTEFTAESIADINATEKFSSVATLPPKPLEALQPSSSESLRISANASAMEAKGKIHLSNLKQYLGKLPLEGVTVEALIPNYFAHLVDD